MVDDKKSDAVREILKINQKSKNETRDTKQFLRTRNLKKWLAEQEKLSEACIMTSDGFKVIDDFKGRYLLHIYNHNQECQENYDQVAHEASQEF